ncbi:glycerate kinase [Amycolatopsis xylanica]|uniref:Glycerate kinase n=1 Tax=Amycolatopsis xylanica TaxID=589385 RepID=A0A1H3QWT9_9PSEU|nr:glycerate kinase [Amycolatopsis xylanica]SDZ18014.1 glycerate kinase [Amycolatopsis xylanica]
MKVVIAPDKFKGSATAVEAADAIALGVLDALPDASVVRCPVADGGEGTLDVLAAAGAEIVSTRVSGPLGSPVDATYAVLDGCAYVESARACGIEFVTPSPSVSLQANTYGVGELIAHALSRGVERLVLTVGGTASTDGGAGMLQALGAQVLDGSDAPIGLGGGPLREVSEVDLTAVLTRLSGITIGVATDVTNPLLGPSGAAAVFGPQKGASPDEVAALEEALTAWARALHVIGADVADIPGSGAGGGIAAAALALGASVESGFDLIVGLTGVESALDGADLVITGEGSLDQQSLAGKAPAGIARRAQGIPLLAIAGRIALDDTQLAALGVVGSRALIDHAPSLEYALANTPALLRAQAADLVRAWARS